MKIKNLFSSLVVMSLLVSSINPIFADDPEPTREQIFTDLGIQNNRIISEETLGLTGNTDITYDFNTSSGITEYEKYLISKSPGYRPGNSITNLDIPDDPDDVRESNILLSALIRAPYNLKTKTRYTDLAKDLDYGVYKPTQKEDNLKEINTEERYGKYLIGSSLSLTELEKISDKPAMGIIHNHVTMSLVGKNILMDSESKETWYKKLSPEAKEIVGSRIKVMEFNGKRNQTILDLQKIFKTKSYKMIAATPNVIYDKEKNRLQIPNNNQALEVALLKYYDKGLGRSSFLFLSFPKPDLAGDRYSDYLNSPYRNINKREPNGDEMSLIGNIQVLRGSTSILQPFLPLFMNDAKIYDATYEPTIKELTEFSVKHYNTFKNDVVQDVNYFTPNKKQTVWRTAFGENETNTTIESDNGTTLTKQIAKSYVYSCENSTKSLLQEEFENASREKLSTGNLYELEILYVNAYEQKWKNLDTIFQVYEQKLKENIQKNNGVLIVDKNENPVLNVFLRNVTNDQILKITEDNFFVLKDTTGKCGTSSSTSSTTKPTGTNKPAITPPSPNKPASPTTTNTTDSPKVDLKRS